MSENKIFQQEMEQISFWCGLVASNKLLFKKSKPETMDFDSPTNIRGIINKREKYYFGP